MLGHRQAEEEDVAQLLARDQVGLGLVGIKGTKISELSEKEQINPDLTVAKTSLVVELLTRTKKEHLCEFCCPLARTLYSLMWLGGGSVCGVDKKTKF